MKCIILTLLFLVAHSLNCSDELMDLAEEYKTGLFHRTLSLGSVSYIYEKTRQYGRHCKVQASQIAQLVAKGVNSSCCETMSKLVIDFIEEIYDREGGREGKDGKILSFFNKFRNFRCQQVTVSPSFDYIAPFKDYNNKIQLFVNGVASAKTIVATLNFRAYFGWGECFGYNVYSLQIQNTQKGNLYQVRITHMDTTKIFNLSRPCDLMGTNAGAQAFPGVAVPIVSQVMVDETKLKINCPCQATQCKDPGNGYRLTGYYAQWSIWDRQFNPYNIPYDSVNQIFYSFIFFNPTNGALRFLDNSAGSWGMSAITRAVLQYPYLEGFLCFGGWSNDGQTTAPMFNQLASSQSSMENFATQSVNLMRKLHFTGIAIDWQWWSDYGNDQAPAKNMLILLKYLKEVLDKAGQQDSKTYKLSMAASGCADRILALQSTTNPYAVPEFWKQISQIVDQINILSYDYHGGFDLNRPAYFIANYDFSNIGNNQVQQDLGWSIKDAIKVFREQGVPLKKLSLGMVLYARTMQVTEETNGGLFSKVIASGFGDYERGVFDYKCLTNPIGSPAVGCGSTSPIMAIKSIQYYSPSNNTQIFNTYGRDVYQVWGYSVAAAAFVTFENPWSATQKTQYLRATGLGGVMFWSMDADSTNPQISLIKTVKKALNS